MSDDPMTAVISNLSIQPAKAAEFEEVFRQLTAIVTSTEPNTLFYQLMRDPKTPGIYTVAEIYKNRAALEEHQANAASNPTIGAINAQMPPFFAGMPDYTAFDLIGDFVWNKAVTPAVAIVAVLPVEAKNAAEFESITTGLVSDVLSKEKGCLMYQFTKRSKEELFAFIELYDSMDSVKAHGKTDYFRAAGKKQGPLFAGKPKLQILEPVLPTGSKM
jgi:quinol monooxygenase YgiN